MIVFTAESKKSGLARQKEQSAHLLGLVYLSIRLKHSKFCSRKIKNWSCHKIPSLFSNIAYVAIDLRSHNNGPSSERWYTWSPRDSTNWRKLVQYRMRWFGHIQRRPPEAPVYCGVLSQANNTRRGRGRPKLIWGKTIKRYLKPWDVPKDLCLNRSTWKTVIEVPEPWLGTLGGFQL